MTLGREPGGWSSPQGVLDSSLFPGGGGPVTRGSGTFLQARHILSGENWGESLYAPSDTRGDNASLAVVKTKDWER